MNDVGRHAPALAAGLSQPVAESRVAHDPAAVLTAMLALEHAARGCALATAQWRDAAAALGDVDARRVAVATADRSLARSDELLALLALLGDVGATSGRPTLTVGAVLGRATGGVAARYPTMVVREWSEISTQRRTMTLAAAGALTVAVCGALGNAARHGPRPSNVAVRATTSRNKALQVRVSGPYATTDGAAPRPPVIVAGRGITAARELIEEAGGTYAVESDQGRVSVDLIVPLAGRWPTLSMARPAGGAQHAASGVLARTVLRIQGAHGMATPLREAQWMVPGLASAQLREALEALEDAADELARRLDPLAS